ncbi:hypothetical protein F5879DRAFT_987224 [Lentinula edodes]|uniref:uncharacterized protein n=1 Tax=Lentinula edodes TaxID=5353 RepID=UPI001E8DAE58|nr:uncharacterized protein C8R40DRAFT_1170675 [Lentinula edodes]KAH7875045.1 hypothetical protein C8R40DRAFT_1170675 [Lentinula edodes]KAJ3906596.1 hypothetical protein F5879DRAFT_987224 [Lentinula edodes]KAJ3915227.1 hypothetical protein F5877DRAFT_82041 [Lentinula edodes]
MPSSQTQVDTVSTPHDHPTVSATSRSLGDSLIDPIYISDSEDGDSPSSNVIYISSESEDEDGHLSQNAITDEVKRDEADLRMDILQYHLCPVCLETAFQPYILECGHTFCVHCLNKLKKICNKKRSSFLCPTCRAKVMHKPVLCFNLQGAAEAVTAHQQVFRPAPKKLLQWSIEEA